MTEQKMEPTSHSSLSVCNMLYERRQQDAKCGEQNHSPTFWLAVLMEEVGEASQGFLKNEPFDYRDELVHVAAVAIAAIESFDRNIERDVSDEKWKAETHG